MRFVQHRCFIHLNSKTNHKSWPTRSCLSSSMRNKLFESFKLECNWMEFYLLIVTYNIQKIGIYQGCTGSLYFCITWDSVTRFESKTGVDSQTSNWLGSAKIGCDQFNSSIVESKFVSYHSSIYFSIAIDS